jgi:glycosyltransferase involved in cell wall biosynthesis
MELNKRKLLFVVNVDWFFISHRLPLAEEAMRRGDEVYLITKDTGRMAELKYAGLQCFEIDFERSGKNPIKELKLISKLASLYKIIQPDLIHHITLKPSIYGTLAAKICHSSARIINTVSGLGYTFTAGRRSVSKYILTFLLKLAFSDKKANFIFQNPDDLAVYKRFGFLNELNNIIIKGAGVDENIFYYREPHSKDTDKIRVVLLARMLKDKGVLEFIKAGNVLKEILQDRMEFVLVGGIDEFNPAAISADTLYKLCDNVFISWLGQRADVMEIYDKADIVCLPSYREGLPKSLVEAMAIGRPLITTDAIGCRECVEEGVNGFLTPIGDHIILAERIKTLVLDKKLRLKMGEASRMKMVKEMSLNNVVKMTFSFYEK